MRSGSRSDTCHGSGLAGPHTGVNGHRKRRFAPGPGPSKVTPSYGLWRSLVSASVWGTEGRGFESRQPDPEGAGERRRRSQVSDGTLPDVSVLSARSETRGQRDAPTEPEERSAPTRTGCELRSH